MKVTFIPKLLYYKKTNLYRITMKKFLPRLQYFFFALVLSATFLFIESCNDLPTRFVAPVFDVGLTVPLIDSLVTLDEMVQDSALLRKDGLGNLILAQRAELAQTKIGDSLRLRPIAVNYTSTIGEQAQILERVSFGYTTELPLKSIYPNLAPPPSVSIIPALSANGEYFESPIVSANDVEFAEFHKATVQVIIKNDFPIDLEIGILPGQTSAGFVISTPGSNDIFLPLTPNQRIIPKSQTRGDSTSIGGMITLQLSEQTLTKDSRIKAILRSNGSNGIQTNYDVSNILHVIIRIRNTTIKQAKVAIDKQLLHFVVSTPLVSNMILTEAELLDFQTNLILTNNFPVSGIATVRLPQLHRVFDGKEFSQEFPVTKNQNRTITLTSGGFGYRISPDSLDQANNNSRIKELHVFIDVLTDAIPSFAKVLFDETDNFKLSGTIAAIGLKYAAGTSLPQTSITFTSKVDFKPQGNIDKITFKRLLAKDAYLELRLLNTAGIEAKFSGNATLLDLNEKVLTTVTIPLQTIQSATIISSPNAPTSTIPYETILSIPLGSLDIPEFPKFARIEATVATSTNTPFYVNNTDYFSGTAEARIPLTINIVGGNFHKTNDLSVSNEIIKRQKNLSSAVLTLEAKNKIPANVGCLIKFYNADSAVILQLPKPSAISLMSASFGADGIANGEIKTTYSLKVDSADVSKILSASHYSIDFNFDAQNKTSGNPYIKFLTSDYLHIRAMLEFKGNTDVR